MCVCVYTGAVYPGGVDAAGRPLTSPHTHTPGTGVTHNTLGTLGTQQGHNGQSESRTVSNARNYAHTHTRNNTH